MQYNLTPSQKKAIQWLVERTESGDLAEDEVLMAYSNDGGVAVQNDRPNLELPPCLTKSTFEILHSQQLIHLRITRNGDFFVTLTGRAYDAIASGFKAANTPSAGDHVIFNLHGDLLGDNARINIQSQDQSINVIDKSATELFDDLRRCIETKFAAGSMQTDLLESVDSMEQADSKSSFMTAYSDFVGLAADHMTVLEPFLVALLQFAQSL